MATRPLADSSGAVHRSRHVTDSEEIHALQKAHIPGLHARICTVPTDPRLLRELVDVGELDKLFSLVTLADMARAWINVQHRDGLDDEINDDDQDWWAMELWWTATWWTDSNNKRVRAGLLALVDAAETDHDLGMIGAAPLESFVSDRADDLDWLESECATRPKLRRALAGVWCSDVVSDSTLDRLDAAAGVRLDRSHEPPVK